MTLRVNNLIGFGVGGSVPIFSGDYGYQTSATDGTEASSYSFASQAFGPAAADRLVIVGIAYTDASGNPDISSVTIGGVSATKHTNARPDSSTSKFCGSAIYSASVPTGATGTIVVTPNQTITNCSISVYSVIGLNSTSDIYSSSTNSASQDDPSNTATVQLDGILVASSVRNDSADSVTWTNATEDHDSSGDDAWSSAHVDGTSDGTLAVTATWTGSSATALSVVAWR
jgi:hypothetical protein